MRYMLFARKKGEPNGGMEDRIANDDTLTGLFDDLQEHGLDEYDWHVYDLVERMVIYMPNAGTKEILNWAKCKDGQNDQ